MITTTLTGLRVAILLPVIRLVYTLPLILWSLALPIKPDVLVITTVIIKISQNKNSYDSTNKKVRDRKFLDRKSSKFAKSKTAYDAFVETLDRPSTKPCYGLFNHLRKHRLFSSPQINGLQIETKGQRPLYLVGLMEPGEARRYAARELGVKLTQISCKRVKDLN